MKNWKTIVLALSFISEAAMARDTYGRDAWSEFFTWKSNGEWSNFSTQDLYADVNGTEFFALERTNSTSRTCIYGFSKSAIELGIHEVPTYYFCFDSGKYEIQIFAQNCVEGEHYLTMNPKDSSVKKGFVCEAEKIQEGNASGGTSTKLLYPVKKDIIFSGNAIDKL